MFLFFIVALRMVGDFFILKIKKTVFAQQTAVVEAPRFFSFCVCVLVSFCVCFLYVLCFFLLDLGNFCVLSKPKNAFPFFLKLFLEY